jgi:molybdate transport system substrate-binding protein
LIFGCGLAATLTGCDSAPAPAPSATPPAFQSRTAPPEVLSEPLPAGEVRVAAASDLKFVLPEVISAFRRHAPNVYVVVTYGSSGNFFAQLSNKAPFDLFLSADVAYPRELIAQGHAYSESEFLYAIGRIVLWVRNDSPLDVEKRGLEALTDPDVRHIAIANPRHAPYGRAAVAAMQSLLVHDQVQSRIVLGENIAQTAQLAESGAADAGIIALSLAIAPELREKGRYWEIPASTHSPIEQGGAILSWAQDVAAARAFRLFLLGVEGKALLRQFGFSLPGD